MIWMIIYMWLMWQAAYFWQQPFKCFCVVDGGQKFESLISQTLQISSSHLPPLPLLGAEVLTDWPGVRSNGSEKPREAKV